VHIAARSAMDTRMQSNAVSIHLTQKLMAAMSDP